MVCRLSRDGPEDLQEDACAEVGSICGTLPDGLATDLSVHSVIRVLLNFRTEDEI